jgi:tRNA pseudouridine65 synthase
MAESQPVHSISPDFSLQVVYRDEDLLAVNKPAGLLVHRSPIDRRDTRFALQMARDLIGQRVYPVHRLDKPTSGLLLFALHPDAARRLASDFAGGAISKRYLAVVRGYLSAQGTIDYPLDRLLEKRDLRTLRSQSAVTDYSALATTELPCAVGRYPTSRYTLAELRPRTGRRHQLRRHMKHIFHPIIGDTRFGEGRHNRFFRETFNSPQLMLAAVEMQFRHPRTGVNLTLTAPLPPTWGNVLAACGWLSALPPRWTIETVSPKSLTHFH